MLRSIGKQSGESVLEKKWKATVGRICRERQYKSQSPVSECDCMREVVSATSIKI